MYISDFQSRFTICGSRLLDERIKRDLRQVVNFLRVRHAAVDLPLAAIWLGGDYGRGEGAVFRLPESDPPEEKPWFDYDFYLLYQRPLGNSAYQALYTAWESYLTGHIGLKVELRSAGFDRDIQHLPPRLEWFQLCQHYQTLWGDSSLKPKLDKAFISSPGDALETLLRGCVYWLSRPQPAQLQEAFYRSAMAASEACLLLHQLYAGSLRERSLAYHQWQQQNPLAWRRELGYLYQEAMQYRFLPSDFSHLPPPDAQRQKQLIKLLLHTYTEVLSHWFDTEVSLESSAQLIQAYLSKQRRRSWRWLSKPTPSAEDRLLELACLLPYVLIETCVPPGTPLPDLYIEIGDTASQKERIRLFLAYWRQYINLSENGNLRPE
ncbi:MAG: hypothetical protein IGS03_15295 [Candidatus Sericytochromatia bacterium]|nr:hypothetical protein [Candidatus Sericytochromatia bacterium]